MNPIVDCSYMSVGVAFGYMSTCSSDGAGVMFVVDLIQDELTSLT